MIHPFFFILGFWVMFFIVFWFFLEAYDVWQWAYHYRHSYLESEAA